MICDAHIHVGYWRSLGGLKYYSPRRVVGVLTRCDVDQFIVSSTSPQAGVINANDLIHEAREVLRLSRGRAHMYCWITGAMFDKDPNLTILNSGVYEGIKLHDYETPWNTKRKTDLLKILKIAKNRHMNVMFHCGRTDGCSPMELAWVAKENPDVHFNFAHCSPIDEIVQVMQMCGNVYTDISCLPIIDVKSVISIEAITHRVMFGSDFPAIFCGQHLTQMYRNCLVDFTQLDYNQRFNVAFKSFIAR